MSAAFAELTGRLLRLPITERETVVQWIGSRTDVALALRRAAYESRKVRVISPPGADTCRVEVAVGIAEMAREWARLLRQASVAPNDELEQIRQWSVHAGEGKLSAGGTAECLGVTSSRPAAAEDGAGMPVLPDGWEYLPAEALDLARRAAAAEAAERMRVRCRALHLGTGETLGDVFDLYGRFEDAFLDEMQRQADGKPIYEPFGVCRLPMKLSLKEIAAVLARAADATSKDVGLPRMDFTQLTDPGQRGSTISVEGVGVPPPARLAWPGRSPSTEAPTWATETLTAIGQSPPAVDMPADLDAAGGREAAIERARLDAIRNMWLQVDELVLPGRRRVQDVVLAHPEVAADLAALEDRMQDVSQPEVNEAGRASVKIMMPLAPLWDVLSRVASRTDRPAAATTRPGAPAARPASQPAEGLRTKELGPDSD